MRIITSSCSTLAAAKLSGALVLPLVVEMVCLGMGANGTTAGEVGIRTVAVVLALEQLAYEQEPVSLNYLAAMLGSKIANNHKSH
jgi:hypothetical protein